MGTYDTPKGAPLSPKDDAVDPSKLQLEVLDVLEDAGVPIEINDKVMEIIEGWERTFLQIGEIARVCKPADSNEAPGWDDDMDRFNGQEMKVIGYPEGYAAAELEGGDGYLFNLKWLERISPPEA